jgi:nucleotide-binding universal stress UspA family protein
MFNKILAAIDRSPFGEYVFAKALSLANALNSELMLLHVLSADEDGSPQPPISTLGSNTYPILENTTLELYRQRWSDYENAGIEFLRSRTEAAIQAGVKTEFTQTPGHPGRVICHLAHTWDATLIVVGRRGRSGLSELFLGSVSNYVLHHAPCEVLTIHTPVSQEHASDYAVEAVGT